MKKITVIGAGNIGSILAVKFSQENDVCLYTNISDQLPLLSKSMTVNDIDNNRFYNGNISLITDNLKEAIEFAEYIFITFPSFLFKDLAIKMIPLLKKNQHLVFVPGSGGPELYFSDALLKGVTISGLQRVHCVARITKLGQSVNESGIKSLLKIASIPTSFNEQACKDIENFYKIKTQPLKNYLNITLINSNPTLHTSRLFCLFKNYYPGVIYERNPLFYEEWDIESANLLSDMDDELTSMFPVLEENGLIVDDIIPIVKYYDSTTPEQMMNKLRSIKGFKGLYSPMIEVAGGFVPDFNSRYFAADFSFGLDLLIEISKMLNTKHDLMEKVSNWYHSISQNPNSFTFKDTKIHNVTEFLNYYKQ